MKDSQLEIEVDGKTYLLAFNLNVMKPIQEKFGSIEDWDKALRKGKDGLDAATVIFTFAEMLNEGIDIQNEDLAADAQQQPLTERKVGRLITKMGLGNAGKQIKDLFVASTKDKNPKNESSTKTKQQ